MKNTPQLVLLGLSHKERVVFSLIRTGLKSPLEIHLKSKISRTAIYHIIKILRKRGLVIVYTKNGKQYVRSPTVREMSDVLYETKKELLAFTDGKEEVAGSTDSHVVIHRGVPALKACFVSIFSENKKTRFIGLQGSRSLYDYQEVFGIPFVNKINALIKKNELIVEGVIPFEWERDTVRAFDTSWATEYIGRMANLHQINADYFKHSAEVFIFKDVLYLISLKDQLIIEVRHSEIVIAITMLIRYITDTTDPIDINREVEKLFKKPG